VVQRWLNDLIGTAMTATTGAAAAKARRLRHFADCGWYRHGGRCYSGLGRSLSLGEWCCLGSLVDPECLSVNRLIDDFWQDAASRVTFGTPSEHPF
jgi:hypothetical protein